jgi:predicted HNH restriction endonuclease
MVTKEAKKGECAKCNNYFYVHNHHIFPKSIFGKGETVELCPNCHTHFHEYKNLKIKNPKSKKETLKIWNKWFTKVAVVCSVALICMVVSRFLF